MNQKKSDFVKCLHDIDPKWRQKVQFQKELELNKLRQLGEDLRQDNFRKEEDLIIKQEIENEIRNTKRNILSKYF